MQIHCEACGTVIPASNINIQEKLAVCPQCGSVFSFVEHLTRKTKTRKIKPPPAYQVSERANTLEINFRWLKLLRFEEHWFTGLCTVGAVLMTGLAINMLDGLNTILEAGVGIGAGLAAFGLVYMVLVILLNRVSITIDDQIIRTKNRPLPFFGHQTNRAEVVRVACEVASYNRDDPDNEFVDYNVQLICHRGRKTNVVTLRRDLAFYTAEIIEWYLQHDELDSEDEGDEGNEIDLLYQDAEKSRSASDADRR